MIHHNLKTLPKYFVRTSEGVKPFEIRLNDRDFQVGDLVTLQWFDPESRTIARPEITKRITYILSHFEGLAPGYVAMTLEDITQEER